MHAVYSPCITLALLTLREGVRQRFLWVLVGMLLLGIFLASFARSLAVTEAQEIFNALLAGFLRLMAVLVFLKALGAILRVVLWRIAALTLSSLVIAALCNTLFWGTPRREPPSSGH